MADYLYLDLHRHDPGSGKFVLEWHGVAKEFGSKVEVIEAINAALKEKDVELSDLLVETLGLRTSKNYYTKGEEVGR